MSIQHAVLGTYDDINVWIVLFKLGTEPFDAAVRLREALEQGVLEQAQKRSVNPGEAAVLATRAAARGVDVCRACRMHRCDDGNVDRLLNGEEFPEGKTPVTLRNEVNNELEKDPEARRVRSIHAALAIGKTYMDIYRAANWLPQASQIELDVLEVAEKYLRRILVKPSGNLPANSLLRPLSLSAADVKKGIELLETWRSTSADNRTEVDHEAVKYGLFRVYLNWLCQTCDRVYRPRTRPSVQ